MMGSVSLPSASTIEQVLALLEVLANPERTKDMLAQMDKRNAEAAAKQKDIEQRERAMGERERAVKIREDKVASEEARLADGHSKLKAGQLDLDRRLGIMKQAMG